MARVSLATASHVRQPTTCKREQAIAAGGATGNNLVLGK